MNKTKKTDAQKAFDVKRLKKAQKKAQKKALKVVQKLQKEIDLWDCDFSRIGIGTMSKVINFSQFNLKHAKKELAKPFVGDDASEDTSYVGNYKNLEL